MEFERHKQKENWKQKEVEREKPERKRVIQKKEINGERVKKNKTDGPERKILTCLEGKRDR